MATPGFVGKLLFQATLARALFEDSSLVNKTESNGDESGFQKFVAEVTKLAPWE